METSKRIKELNVTRKGLQSLYTRFSHLDGKHCSRNQSAYQELYTAVDMYPGLLPQSFVSYRKGKRVFDFSGVQCLIDDTQERIHQLDTIDTLDLAPYIAAVKAVIVERDRIQSAIKGEHYHLAKQELDKLTGYNL